MNYKKKMNGIQKFSKILCEFYFSSNDFTIRAFTTSDSLCDELLRIISVEFKLVL